MNSKQKNKITSNINKAKAFYKSSPFITKLYMAMELKIPYKFISDNWKEITGKDYE